MTLRTTIPAFLGACLLLACTAVPCGAQSFIFLAAYYDGDVQGAKTIDGLSFVYATAVSPDGQHVYACSGNGGLIESDNAVAAFSRAADGRLSFVEALFDADDSNDPGPADGLFSCRDVAVSPDGKHVYTAGFSDNKVGIFLRNATTGVLTFDSVAADGVGLDGLAGTESIAVTADGASVFVAGSIDDAVVAFSRNSTTGALTFEDSVKEGIGGVTGLDRPVAVAVSPDGKHVYTAAGGNGNFTGSDAVAVFEWDAVQGDLIFVDSYFEGEIQGAKTIDGLHRVSSVVVSPDGKHVYATGGLDPFGDQDWIAVFSRDSSTGALTFVTSIDHFTFCNFDILFEFETYAAISPDGERVFVTSSATAITEFSRNPTTGALTFAHAKCLFDDLTLGINLPRKIALDPTGTYLYVPGNADDAVAVFDTGGIFADGFESGDLSAWSASVP